MAVHVGFEGWRNAMHRPVGHYMHASAVCCSITSATQTFKGFHSLQKNFTVFLFCYKEVLLMLLSGSLAREVVIRRVGVLLEGALSATFRARESALCETRKGGRRSRDP